MVKRLVLLLLPLCCSCSSNILVDDILVDEAVIEVQPRDSFNVVEFNSNVYRQIKNDPYWCNGLDHRNSKQIHDLRLKCDDSSVCDGLMEFLMTHDDLQYTSDRYYITGVFVDRRVNRK